jgi:hypothetical protein
MPRTSPATKATDSEGALDGALSVSDFLSVLLGRALSESRTELERAKGGTGRVHVNLELHLVNGQPRWHSASAYFAEHQQYTKES